MSNSTTIIETRTGNDPGSRAGNNWDKTRVTGLDLVTEARQHATRRENYTLAASEAGNGRVFSFWTSADGGKSVFAICVVEAAADPAELSGFNGCYVRGRFRVLAQAEGDTFAPRLLSWWDAGNKAKAAESKAAKEAGGKSTWTWDWQQRFARHLSTQITRRGVKDPAPME